MPNEAVALLVISYIAGLIVGTVVGVVRGSAILGFLWTFMLGPVGLVLVFVTTGRPKESVSSTLT